MRNFMTILSLLALTSTTFAGSLLMSRFERIVSCSRAELGTAEVYVPLVVIGGIEDAAWNISNSQDGAVDGILAMDLSASSGKKFLQNSKIKVSDDGKNWLIIPFMSPSSIAIPIGGGSVHFGSQADVTLDCKTISM